MTAVPVSPCALVDESEMAALRLRVFKQVVKRGVRREYAEDVAQDALLSLWIYRESGEEIQALHAWLRRVAMNRALRLLGRDQRYVPLPDIHPAIHGSDDLERDEVVAVRVDAVKRVMDRLPPLDRDLVIACLLEGESRAVAAEKFGLSVKAVGSRLYRAKKMLRRNIPPLPENFF